MESDCFEQKSVLRRVNRRGAVLLLILLIIVVLGGLIWMGSSVLTKDSDPVLPWNEDFRILKHDQQIEGPSEEQPYIEKTLQFKSKVEQYGSRRGRMTLLIRPDGRIEGGWSGRYKPKPEIEHDVMMADFKGNIDASKIYSDESGEDFSLLYFIAKGKFVILKSNTETNKTRDIKGSIYITGWLDTEYNATGEIIITVNKREFEAFSWSAKAVLGSMW